MSIVLFLQNLTQIFWSIIVALNLYVLLLLYRVSKLYRSERFNKLEATAFLRNQVDCMRDHYLNSSTSELITVNHKSASTAVEDKIKTTNNELPLTSLSKKVKTPARSKSLERKKLTKTMKSFTDMKNASSSSSMLSLRSDDNRKNTVMNEQHTLYISDSFGRVVQEIPFKEEDYLEALCSVLNN